MIWICLLTTLLFVLVPEASIAGLSAGFRLWTDILIPSLAPFMLISEWMLAAGWLHAAGNRLAPWMAAWFRIRGTTGCAVVIGFLSGYPMTARMISTLYEQNQITKEEARRVAGWATTADPVFIAGAVAAGLFGRPSWSVYLLISHFASAILLGWLSGRLSIRRQPPGRTTTIGNDAPAGTVPHIRQPSANRGSPYRFRTLAAIFLRTYRVLLVIGGMVIAGTVWIHASAALLKTYGNVFMLPDLNGAAVAGAVIPVFFEVTLGMQQIAGLSGFSTAQLLPAASAALAWGGICVHAQILVFLHQTNMRWIVFAGYKAAHASLAWLVCYLCIKGMQAVGQNGFIASELQSPVFLSLQPQKNLLFDNEHADFVKSVILFSFIFITLLVYWCMKSTDTTLRWDHDEKCDECESGDPTAGTHRTTG